LRDPCSSPAIILFRKNIDWQVGSRVFVSLSSETSSQSPNLSSIADFSCAEACAGTAGADYHGKVIVSNTTYTFGRLP
jgi:hypothetical protein